MIHAVTDNDSRLWNQATFLPDDLTARSEILLESVSKKLQSSFLAFCLYVSALQPGAYAESSLAEHSLWFQSLAREQKRLFVEYPIFRIWLKQATRSLETCVEVKSTISELIRVIEEFEKGAPHHTLETDCGTIEILRHSPDPLILKALRRDYTFPSETRRKDLEQVDTYPISSVIESVHAALLAIKLTWFEAYRVFFKFVKVVIDSIDANFRSYSSQEITGVILIETNSEPSLLEEYLIHELGHQILENVMELDPLVMKEETKRKFSLPWSGKETDVYGYLHAFFIYLMLFNYYGRVKLRSSEEPSLASDRLAHIREGLVRAVHELELANLFTPRGKQLFENLKIEVQRAVSTYPVPADSRKSGVAD